MKTPQLLFISLLAGSLMISRDVQAQANASLNILSLNSGQLDLGATGDIQVTVGNTGPGSSIGANKVRAQISVPTTLVSTLTTPQQTGLPPGWTITVNSGGSITVCNGSDVIPVGQQRQIFIKIHGDAMGGPSTINGSLIFSSGTSCTAPGTLTGDNTADNTGTTSIQVNAIIVPVTLTDFNATLVNCQPVLNWTTETEINIDRYEVEKSGVGNSDWTTVGTLTATGNNSTRAKYNFADRNAVISSEYSLYRLKIIDKDGSAKYSKSIRVYTNCNTAHISVYPNPVKDGWLYVSLTNTTGITEATLSSMSGQVVMRAKVSNGANHLNVSHIADGVYMLNVKDRNGFDEKLKVFVQN